MSRIGKQPVAVPDGVQVKLDGRHVEVKGPKGTLTCVLPALIDASLADAWVTFTPHSEGRVARANWGLGRTLVQNLVTGVSAGFQRCLLLQGTGYRCEQRKISGSDWLQFALGYSHPILFELPEAVTAEVEKSGRITLKSPNKQLLGMIAAQIRSLRPPEPYKGKGIRYEDEHVRRKVGKAGAR